MTLHKGHKLKPLKGVHDKVSVSEYNKTVNLVMKMSQSLVSYGIMDSTGFCTRRPPIAEVADGSRVRKAFCKNDAGASTTIDCYLDVDTTGTEVSVTFEVVGGGNCNAAIPRLEDGDVVFVTFAFGTWHALAPLQATEDCDCYEE